MLFTPLIPSTDVKGPFCERYSSILFAIAGPMPGNASRSFAEAVLGQLFREKQEDDDVELKEFDDEIEQWIIDEFTKVGLDTARSVLDKDTDVLLNLVDLEEETIEEVKRILREELE